MNRFQIRPIALGDSLDDLTSMVHRAFASLGRQGLSCTAVDQGLNTTSRRVRRGTCLVALTSARIVGTITLESPDHSSDILTYRHAGVASIHQFAVDPCEQGRGCGQALLDAAVAWARQRDFSEIALDTPSDAARLVSLYQRHGFRHVETLQVPGRRYASAVMSRTVRHAQTSSNVWYAPHRLGGGTHKPG